MLLYTNMHVQVQPMFAFGLQLLAAKMQCNRGRKKSNSTPEILNLRLSVNGMIVAVLQKYRLLLSFRLFCVQTGEKKTQVLI